MLFAVVELANGEPEKKVSLEILKNVWDALGYNYNDPHDIGFQYAKDLIVAAGFLKLEENQIFLTRKGLKEIKSLNLELETKKELETTIQGILTQ